MSEKAGEQSKLAQGGYRSGLSDHFKPYKNKFNPEFFRDRIPLELLMKPKPGVEASMYQLKCMICRNIVNIGTSLSCNLCYKPCCHQCYVDLFLKHDDHKYQMPCLCYIDMKLTTKIETKSVNSKYKIILQQLQFRCYLSEQCPATLTYQNFTGESDHAKQCDFASMQCNNCRRPVIRGEMIAHRYMCSELKVSC